MSDRKISFKGNKKPHGYLSNGAWYMLKVAGSTHEGKYYYLCASLLFSAFTLESYLNYIGLNYINFWSRIEKINVRDKLNVIYEYKSINVDWGNRPFQTIIDLFRFRNMMAHAKPSEYSGTTTIKDEDFDFFDVKEFWETYPTTENAEMAKDDVLRIMENLKEIYNDNAHIMDLGSQFWHDI